MAVAINNKKKKKPESMIGLPIGQTVPKTPTTPGLVAPVPKPEPPAQPVPGQPMVKPIGQQPPKKEPYQPTYAPKPKLNINFDLPNGQVGVNNEVLSADEYKAFMKARMPNLEGNFPNISSRVQALADEYLKSEADYAKSEELRKYIEQKEFDAYKESEFQKVQESKNRVMASENPVIQESLGNMQTGLPAVPSYTGEDMQGQIAFGANEQSQNTGLLAGGAALGTSVAASVLATGGLALIPIGITTAIGYVGGRYRGYISGRNTAKTKVSRQDVRKSYADYTAAKANIAALNTAINNGGVSAAQVDNDWNQYLEDIAVAKSHLQYEISTDELAYMSGGSDEMAKILAFEKQLPTIYLHIQESLMNPNPNQITTFGITADEANLLTQNEGDIE